VSSAPFGLIAGGGELPVFLSSALKKMGHRVALVGFRGETSEGLLGASENRIIIDVGEWKRGIDFLREAGVRETFLAGYVSHTNIFRKESLGTMDSLASMIMRLLGNKQAETILKAAVWALKKNGIHVVSPMQYLQPLMIGKGVLTKRAPTEDEWKDIKFGQKMARKMAGLDIGQTVAVKSQAVVAVESLEGTDATIIRAGTVAGEGVSIVKVARPRQDFRFDVPVIGPRTLESLRTARAGVLAVEAGRTFVMDRDGLISGADASGISVVGL
jgi:DUF1009 family protein